MLKGLAKAKALKEFKEMRNNKASLKGLALAKGLKRLRELRTDLGMGKKQDEQKVYVDTLIFNQDRKMLLVQRHAQDDFMPNKWWFVGGKLEHGETVEQGAIRELKEETGIKLLSLTLVEKKTLDNGSISHRFVGTVQNDVAIHLAKDELQDYRWVSIDELSQFDLVGNLTDLTNLYQKAIDNFNPLQLSELVVDESITGKDLNSLITQWLRDNLQGKSITTVDDKVVRFNNKSTSHISHDIAVKKNLIAKAVAHIVEVFTTGEFIERQELYKPRAKDRFVAFHVYRKWVDIDNLQVHLQVKAGELDNGLLESGNGLIAYSAKDLNQFDGIKKDTQSIPHWKNQLSGETSSVSILDDINANSKISQDEYVFLEILEVREKRSDISNTSTENQSPKESYSPDNRYAHGKYPDFALANEFEKRLKYGLTTELLTQYEALVKQYGYVYQSAEPIGFNAKKQVGDRTVFIVARFKNSPVRDHQVNAYDYQVFLSDIESGLENASSLFDDWRDGIKWTNDLSQAISWGESWLNDSKISKFLYDSILNHEKAIDLDILLSVQKEIDQDPNHYQINDVLDELEKQAREIGLMI